MSIERARELRKAMMMTAEGYTDEQAAKVPTLYLEWVVNEGVSEGVRRFYAANGKLYKCKQAHTTQADWAPDKTPAMWTVIDVVHEGTITDPITASAGMEYVYGKYYLDPADNKAYLCTRAGTVDGETITLYYLPHELVGQYFELA